MSVCKGSHLHALFRQASQTCNPDFRLFLSTESTPEFPIGLLQRCTTVVNETPKGLKASLLYSYTHVVDQDKIERIETAEWRSRVYALAFMHSVLCERRKFGALGLAIPYEFNSSDLSACLHFLEKHLYGGHLSWQTLQYMVCEVQYGGKITDDMDRRVFNAYTQLWLAPTTLHASFTFGDALDCASSAGGVSSSSRGDQGESSARKHFDFSIPDFIELSAYHTHINQFPDVDRPGTFCMGDSADLTFRNKEAKFIFDTLAETQPKTSAVDGGSTREDLVSAKGSEILSRLPIGFNDDDTAERIGALGGLSKSLNVFLNMEIVLIQNVLALVKEDVNAMLQAIRGEIVMTPRLLQIMNEIYNAKAPKSWVKVSWRSDGFGSWFSSLVDRCQQYERWLQRQPKVYWMSGFFSPTGFLTAVKQQSVRKVGPTVSREIHNSKQRY